MRLLLLDEPFEGLATAVIEELFAVFDKLRRHVPILIVEHNLDLVLALADRVFALERGAVFHEGPADALLADLGYRKQILWDYIGHGVRARAQALMTLELGPESELERLQKLASEVEQERFTRLDRALVSRAKDNILVAGGAGELAPAHQTMQAGRLKALERLGLAEERRPGVWVLDASLEIKLRQLGDRADTYRMMERALKQAGIERGGPQLAVFERGRRTAPVIGKVIAVGLVDEITDRQYVIVDGADGRVHYAELGRLRPDETLARGMIVSLVSDRLEGKPRSTPRLTVLSPVELERLPTYDGPIWLDRAVTAKERISTGPIGFGAELSQALHERRQWLSDRQLAEFKLSGELMPKPQMITALQERERVHLAKALSRQLDASYMPNEPGSRVSAVYERSVSTPSGKLAVIRREGTFKLAPWNAALEQMRGLAVIGATGPQRVAWTLDRGRGRTRVTRIFAPRWIVLNMPPTQRPMCPAMYSKIDRAST